MMKQFLVLGLIWAFAASRAAADDAVGVGDLDAVLMNYDRDGDPGWQALSRTLPEAERKAGFKLLFNGEDLDGWKAGENPGSFSVREGALVAGGARGHLFYAGPVNQAVFTNFHLKVQVKTRPKANSGIYFHSEYQDRGWPKKGYEAQVNNSGKDAKRTGGLYGAADNMAPVAADNRWFLYEIIVKGKHVEVKVDGKTITDYTEVADVAFPGWPGRRLSRGTFALQAHDPGSEVLYRAIRVRTME